MSDFATDPIERRLRRLEGQWRAAGAVMILLAVTAATTAFARQGAPAVRTGRLELVDGQGRVRATLAVGRDAAAWTLTDSAGRAVAALTLEGSGQIAVRDADGRVQAILGAATVHRITER